MFACTSVGKTDTSETAFHNAHSFVTHSQFHPDGAVHLDQICMISSINVGGAGQIAADVCAKRMRRPAYPEWRNSCCPNSLQPRATSSTPQRSSRIYLELEIAAQA
jgi:hypothetical protein